jgi:DNA-binding CsgD family transcriptional regulator/tetratricopeptide (TPR) repeat protein
MLEGLIHRGALGGHAGNALRVLGEISLYQDSFLDAIGLFERALSRPDVRPHTQAVIEANLAFATVVGGDFAGALSHAERARSLARYTSDSTILGQATAVAAIARYLSGHGLDEAALDGATASEDWGRPSLVQIRPTLIAGTLYLYDGQFARSREALERLRRELLDRGQESDLPWVSSQLAWLCILTGDLLDARRYADEALDAADRHGSRSARSFSLGYIALVCAHQGQADAARQAATEAFALGEETGFRIAAVWAAQALSVLGVALGQARAVDEVLGGPVSMIEREGLIEAIRAPWLGDEIEALIALGELERAERLLKLLEATTRGRLWVRVTAARGRSLLHAARRELEAARGAIRTVLDDPGIDELPIEHGRCLLVIAQVERRAKRRGAARDALLQAEALFSATGAGLWLPRVRDDLDRLGLDPGDRLGLTASEERIAGLAAGGATNREIAAQLLISPKTVEATLARAYAKLQIRSRAQLGAALARVAEKPPGAT